MLCVSTNGDFFELTAYTDDIVYQGGMQLFDRRKTFFTSSKEKICAVLLRKGEDVHITTVSRRLKFQFDLISNKPARKLVGEYTAIRFIIRSTRRMFSLASHFY